MKTIPVFICAVLLLGCGGGEPVSSEPKDAGIRDTMSQRNSLGAGKRTADRLKQLDADRQKEIEEALDK